MISCWKFSITFHIKRVYILLVYKTFYFENTQGPGRWRAAGVSEFWIRAGGGDARADNSRGVWSDGELTEMAGTGKTRATTGFCRGKCVCVFSFVLI